LNIIYLKKPIGVVNINMKRLFLILLLCIFIIPGVSSASINLTPAHVGVTYIEWIWDNGINVSDIFIDGFQMCGYETTNNTFLLPGLNPDELHTIVVITPDGGNDSNITYTLGNGTICPEPTECPTIGPTQTPGPTPTPGPTSPPPIPPIYSNVSRVVNGGSYTSMTLYYMIIILFSACMLASLFLDGGKRPFEKLFAAIAAFLLSLGIAYASFSLALVSFTSGGMTQQVINNTTTQTHAIVPTIIMQNSLILEIATWILVILCFINIINCILVLIDYTKMTKGVKKE
jgi:hypothetical protein